MGELAKIASQLILFKSITLMLVQQRHKPSPIHHHLYGWYVHHPFDGGLWHCYTHITLQYIDRLSIDYPQIVHRSPIDYPQIIAIPTLMHILLVKCPRNTKRSARISSFSDRLAMFAAAWRSMIWPRQWSWGMVTIIPSG